MNGWTNMSTKKTRAVVDEVEKVEALGRQVMASFAAASKLVDELQDQSSRTKALALGFAKANSDGVATTKSSSGTDSTSRDIERFVTWIEATFQTRNARGLRELAAAFADKDQDKVNRFVGGDENVTIFSVPLDSKLVESAFAGVGAPATSPEASSNVTVVHGMALTRHSQPASPTASTKPTKRRTSKSDDRIAQATPTPSAKKPKLIVDVPVPGATSTLNRTNRTKSPQQVALLRKRRARAVAPGSLTSFDEDTKHERINPAAQPPTFEVRRRPSERGAAALSNIVRREQDAKLRGLNDERDRSAAPSAPVGVPTLDEDGPTDKNSGTPAAETPAPVPDGRRRPSERGAAAVSNFLRRERDKKLRVLNDEPDTTKPKPTKPKQTANDTITNYVGAPKGQPNKHVIHVGAAIMPAPGSGGVKATYDAVLKTKPWLKWSQHFHTFLPTGQRGRMAWSASLSSFFEQHAFAMWSQFFLMDHVRSKDMQDQYDRALHACFRLVHRLHTLEGDDVFKFLLRTPHPAWPTFLATPISLAAMPPADAIAYIKAQANSRFPRSPTPSTYEPMQVLKEMVKAKPCVLEEALIPVDFAPNLLARLEADATYDFDDCPYIGVTMFGEDAPAHLVDGEYSTP
ncbi:hypothetical protein DYB32_009885, partial [Aphanomyces invadans]